jgi:hypothetical protein
VKRHSLLLATFLFLSSCARTAPSPAAPTSVLPATQPSPGPDTLQSLHVRLVVDTSDGSVRYLGWYDGRRNLLGPNGIVAAIVGVEPPELKGQLARAGDAELVFTGADQNQINWVKRYRLDGNTVHVTYRVTSHRDQPFDAIVYSLADLPDATISGDNRDQHIRTPDIKAHFRATIDDPNFPGEQMNPYAMRSDSRRLEPGDSMEFRMTWELEPTRRER